MKKIKLWFMICLFSFMGIEMVFGQNQTLTVNNGGRVVNTQPTITFTNNISAASFNGNGIGLLAAHYNEYQKWSNPIQVMSGVNSWEVPGGVGEASIFHDENGKLALINNMIYLIYSGVGNALATNYLGLAFSTDVTNWTRLPNPVIGGGHGGEPGVAIHSWAMKIGNIFYVYYLTNTAAETFNVLYATSSDGSNYIHGGTAYTFPISAYSGNICVISNSYDHLWYMSVESKVIPANWKVGWATSAVPTGPFVEELRNDTSLDAGLGSWSDVCIQKIAGNWHAWYHVSDSNMGTLSYIAHAYNTNSTPVGNWNIAESTPLFSPQGKYVAFGTTNFGFGNCADAKSVFEYNGNSYMLFTYGSETALANSGLSAVVLSSFPSNLTNLVTSGPEWPARSICVVLTNDTTIANNTWVYIQPNNVLYNTGIMFEQTTGEFVIKKTGLYKMDVQALWNTVTSTTTASVIFYRLSTDTVFNVVGGAPNPYVNSYTAVLNKGDRITVRAFQNSGASRTLTALGTVVTITFEGDATN